MADPTRDANLERECRVFARYLARVEPDDYVQQRYAAFHARLGAEATHPLDRALLAVARLGRGATVVADAYAGRLSRRSVLRRKLIAVLALLESSAPAFAVLDAPYRGGSLRVYAKLVARAALEGAALAIGLVVFGPLHLVIGLAPRRS